MAFENNLVTILGDSYSTFKGSVPEKNYLYYPNEGIPDVASSADTWWSLLIEKCGLKLLLNDSSSGTTISTRVRPEHTIEDAFINRMKHSLSEEGVNGERPGVILIFGGTNDSWIGNEAGEVQFENWTDEDLVRTLPAYCYLLDYVTKQNPQAKIVCIFNCDIREEIQRGQAQACAHYGVTGVQLEGVSKINGHPDKLGMQQICDQVSAAL